MTGVMLVVFIFMRLWSNTPKDDSVIVLVLSFRLPFVTLIPYQISFDLLSELGFCNSYVKSYIFMLCCNLLLYCFVLSCLICSQAMPSTQLQKSISGTVKANVKICLHICWCKWPPLCKISVYDKQMFILQRKHTTSAAWHQQWGHTVSVPGQYSNCFLCVTP